MEDVLDLYEAASDPKRPRLGFDERPCQLLGQIVAPLPMKPGRVKREDNEYKRNGTAVVLLAYVWIVDDASLRCASAVRRPIMLTLCTV